MITRRSILKAAALLVPMRTWWGTLAAAAQPHRIGDERGCWLDEAELASLGSPDSEIRTFLTGSEPVIPKSGDAMFDRALAQTLAKISGIFGVIPGFGYYDDYDGLNAYASPAVRMAKSDGTVLFGIGLLKQLRSKLEAPEIGVAAVCAHEFGHIVQFKRGLRQPLLAGQSTVKRLELHADFLAGVFAGIRKRERPEFPAAIVAMTQWSVGDHQTQSPQHHGTPKERGDAVAEGFSAIKDGNLTFDAALRRGVEYVSSL